MADNNYIMKQEPEMSNLNLETARVVSDSSYSPARYYIEDGAGRVARKAKSHCATHAAARFWRSREAAQAALDKARGS